MSININKAVVFLISLIYTIPLSSQAITGRVIDEGKNPVPPAVYIRSVDRHYDRMRNRLVFAFSYRFAGGKSVRKYNREMSKEE